MDILKAVDCAAAVIDSTWFRMVDFIKYAWT